MVKIWGHRGCRGAHNPPENSLAAFDAAIKQGADGFELDVFLTRDNQLVVFHDDTLEAMTDGSGPITDKTLAELQVLRLRNVPKGTLTGHQIPTLDAVLDLANQARRGNPDFTVNIEIKGLGIASRVADTLRERFATGWQPQNFLISSFDMKSLREMRKAHPQVPIGALFEAPAAPWDISEQLLRQRIDETRDIHPDTINITLPSITPAAVKMIADAGARPVAWTVGEINPEMLMQAPDGGAAAATRILNSGLEAMITDYPKEMRMLIDKFASRKTTKNISA